MTLPVIRLLVDFGLVVLIWITQLIVYPGFLHYPKSNLMAWHGTYTTMIGYIVAPLMLLQLGLYLHLTLVRFSVPALLALILVMATWGVTFLQFVPMHGAITTGDFDQELLKKLVSRNWIRTALWTLIFTYSFIRFTAVFQHSVDPS